MNNQKYNKKEKSINKDVFSMYKSSTSKFLSTTAIFSVLLYSAFVPGNMYDGIKSINEYGIANASNNYNNHNNNNNYNNHNANAHPRKEGFDGPVSSRINTVEQAINNGEDKEYLSIEGNIINRVSKDKYTFKDNTGEIILEIDDKHMPMDKITPSTKVKIFGKISKKIFQSKIKIDVKKLEIIDNNGVVKSYSQ